MKKITDQVRILKEFQEIPGVGKSIAMDLWEMDYRSTLELIDQNPEEMYDRFCNMKSMHIDMCLLYVFRCAVYFVSNNNHDPELLKWWNWKDRKL